MAELEFRDLTAEEIDCRVASISDKGLSILLYKDARCDMIILDQTVGALNWQRSHSRDNANCIVSIWDAEKEAWISKEDTGTESNTEAAKGLASDSFKRACFNWGIGRELYTAPFIWIPAEKCNITTRKDGKKVCYDKFTVEAIEIEDKKIKSLTIVNQTSGDTVFTFSNGKVKKEKTTKKAVKQQTPEPTPVPEPVATSEQNEPEDPEKARIKAKYQELIKFCKENELDINEVAETCGLSAKSGYSAFATALAYAETIALTGGAR